MLRFKRKRSAALALLLALSVTVGAIAYWTSGGSGTGTAPTGTSAALTANQTTTVAPMYPGDSAQTLSGDFANTNSGPSFVSTVTPRSRP